MIVQPGAVGMAQAVRRASIENGFLVGDGVAFAGFGVSVKL